MSTHDEYAKRFQAGNWKPKSECRTAMANPPAGIAVERLDNVDFGATEPDLVHQWATSTQPRFMGLVQVSDGNVRNLQTVLFNVEADTQMRIRAHAQLIRNSAQGCLDSAAVLAQWRECGLTIG